MVESYSIRKSSEQRKIREGVGSEKRNSEAKHPQKLKSHGGMQIGDLHHVKLESPTKK